MLLNCPVVCSTIIPLSITHMNIKLTLLHYTRNLQRKLSFNYTIIEWSHLRQFIQTHSSLSWSIQIKVAVLLIKVIVKVKYCLTWSLNSPTTLSMAQYNDINYMLQGVIKTTINSSGWKMVYYEHWSPCFEEPNTEINTLYWQT